MSKLIIKKDGKNLSIICSECSTTLILISKSFKIKPISSCKHFEIVQIHKNDLNNSIVQKDIENSIMTFIDSNYINLIVPRKM